LWLCNFDKVFYFVIGIIKVEVIDYYVWVVEVMLSLLAECFVSWFCWFDGVVV